MDLAQRPRCQVLDFCSVHLSYRFQPAFHLPVADDLRSDPSQPDSPRHEGDGTLEAKLSLLISRVSGPTLCKLGEPRDAFVVAHDRTPHYFDRWTRPLTRFGMLPQI